VEPGTWLFADPTLGLFPACEGLVPLVIDDSGEKALYLGGLMGRVGIEYVRP
jgi:hypothetical protein